MKELGCCLGVKGQELQEIYLAQNQPSEKGYHMLKHWKERNGSAATYEALRDALKHVGRPDLAEKFCCGAVKINSSNHINGAAFPTENLLCEDDEGKAC